MRRLVAVLAALTVFGGVALAATPPRPVSELEYVTAKAGDSWFGIRRELGLTCTHTDLWAFNGGGDLLVGQGVFIPPACRVPATTTTTVPTTTTTTVPPTTTTTTVPPTTTSTTVAAPTAGYLENFNGLSFAKFQADWRYGVYHRDNSFSAQPSWPADHAFIGTAGDCTTPEQTHEAHRSNPAESFYICGSVNGNPAAGHLMTSTGDTSPYSITWFTPKRTFTTEDTVSWDVNVTDLGTRQWWEVMLVPASSPDLACEHFFPCGLPHEGYAADSLVVANNNRFLRLGVDDGGWKVPGQWFGLCDTFNGLDPAGCASKAIRRSFELTDNHNGTVTLTYSAGTVEMYSWTMAGSFPAAPWKVVFKDHDYTPIKDGPVVGYTWHWDNVEVR